ncbi:hypothetical protein [Bradyrhizobium sp. 145]|uniref:hypothetical protein n=2 Tax=Bradyrhizobium TaxID=374 RepID=UPI001FFB4E22|nr:hypothetical protein [Bradyrhizobium sp. 145]MCK1684403.1 hypothetical protein [Bradyrhizobium sp. 145]
MSLIGREFGLKPHQRKDLQKALRDENHPTTLKLKELGVTYGSEGKGRGAKSFLVKAAQLAQAAPNVINLKPKVRPFFRPAHSGRLNSKAS